MDDEKVPAPDLLGDGGEVEEPVIEPILRSVSRAEQELEKTGVIEEAFKAGDHKAIAELAISKDGLLNDKIRRKACAYSIILMFGAGYLLILLNIRRASTTRVRKCSTPVRRQQET